MFETNTVSYGIEPVDFREIFHARACDSQLTSVAVFFRSASMTLSTKAISSPENRRRSGFSVATIRLSAYPPPTILTSSAICRSASICWRIAGIGRGAGPASRAKYSTPVIGDFSVA